MSDIINLSLRLLIITAVAALILGYTYMVTEEPIALQIEEANINARKAVLKEASEFNEIDVDSAKFPKVTEAYEGTNNGKPAGYVVKVTEQGYGGDLEVLIGIGADSCIKAVQILSHSETPGLGAKAADPGFLDQYSGISADGPVEADDVDAVTGATITSDAVRSAVNISIGFAKEQTESGGDTN